MVTKKSSPPTAISFDESKYRAEDDLRTLSRAKEIEADRQRLIAAQKCGAEKIKAMQKVVAKTPPPVKKK